MTSTADIFEIMKNKVVINKVHGEGKIKHYEESGYIDVEYVDGSVLTYTFPGSFLGGILSTEDSELLQYISTVHTSHTSPDETYIRLVKRIRLASDSFEGPIHTTGMDNFLSIMNTGFLLSRDDALKAQLLTSDFADQEVLNHTQNVILKYVRFYYGYGTPTNYRARYKVPVIMVFSPLIMKDDGVFFCEGNAASPRSNKTGSMEEALAFDWENIFERGPMIYGYDDIFDKKRKRNAELLHNDAVSTDRIKKIFFRTKAELDYAKKMLGEKLDLKKCEVNSRRFVGIGVTDDEIL